MSLNEKVAIVTGASRGIGRQVAIQLARSGAKVAVNYSSSRGKADEVVKSIEQFGGHAVAIQADVSKVNEVEVLFSETLERFGRVDILVNNAGIMENHAIADMSEEIFDRHFALNVKGTYFACQQAMKHMAQGGTIINFSTSVSGAMLPTYSVYAATKGAIEQLTRQLAKEFGPKNIVINCIAPGQVATDMFLDGKSPELVDSFRQMNAFGRLGEPEDIANVLELLVSDKAHWITGQTIRVNGGFN
ncbi:short-chain dehydrogenase/reductase SDR [Paenibacillus mucilaginosus 3016]|uniref:Short-chain dehydrogenase/reductase SDR n=2 Tax=Paenibacillus mucilaginosus TaxID=61624 RepID=H6NCI0_9BACL|nr:SDR family oxidoreductase [Paenibacillus mucilaginosus]AFC28593.1 short-chain dehydrogenase/reductase SDR [Paenibacillus mucilaginosus 3016]AFH60760.1 3-ketoacyl-ACP reductase [Paenibacillus mucilaginosus K02]WFA17376.1 SDR family oxidoreductase [Paenibacillus mucilaginosus]